MVTARPNVIVFFTDQQRWDTTGAHDNPLGLTPNFDRMTKFGTHVYHSFTVQPVCGPSRACLQTGRYATETGCYRNEIPLPPDARSLGQRFRDAGYATGYIGKWHLAAQEPVPLAKRGGYEHWLAADKLEFTSDAYHTVLYDGDQQPVRLPGYRVDALTDAAIRFIDGHQRDPFFLFLSFLEPHHQNHLDDYPPPDGYRERYAGRWTPPDLAALGGSAPQHLGGYYGMVKRLDEALGRLLDALKSLDLAQDTIVLFTSDHGSHFRTRNDEYKRSCHDASIRVPTALVGPGFNGGGTVMSLVSILDLTATLIDAAGLPLDDRLSGRSILPLLRREPDLNWQDELFVQISESQVGRALRTRRWKYGVIAPEASGWNDAYSDAYVEETLYDLQYDPYELKNLIGLNTHQALADVLRGRLLKRIEAVEGRHPHIEPAPAREDPGQRVVYTDELWA
jgi:arylsulfatase A-like enzyme